MRGGIGKFIRIDFAIAALMVAALSGCASDAERRPQAGGASSSAPLPSDPSPQRPPQPVILSSSAGFLECVPYARSLSGIQIRGDAHTWWRGAKGRYARGHAPREGAVIVLRTGAARGHIATVTRALDDRTIVAEHANWLNRGKIHRETPIRDVSPAGDWSAVRVWYTPGGVWGRSVYNVEGFVYPEMLTASSGS